MIIYLLMHMYVQVHAKAVITSKQSLLGRILRRQQSSDTLDSTSNSINALSEHTKPQVRILHNCCTDVIINLSCCDVSISFVLMLMCSKCCS
jgi:hypothetical protein